MTTTDGPRSAWPARVGAPVDGASLAALRVLFGLLMFAGLTRFLLSGWVHELYVLPAFHFKYWGFSWVTVWPAWGMYLHFAALAVLALMVAAGLCYRVAAPLFALGFGHVQLMDVTNYLNHYYLVVLLGLLLAVVPAHRVWSLDALRRPHSQGSSVPAWTVYLVRFQVAVVYFYAGLAKLGGDWLLHAQPLDIWLSARTGTPLLGPLFAHPAAPHVMSWGGFLFDTTIVLWLSLRRTRPYAYAALLVFHTLTGLLFEIGMFPYIMSLAALIFFPPGWPRALVRAGSPRAPVSGPNGVERRGEAGGLSGVPFGFRARAGATAVLVYCLLQVLVPLRHFAYPGEVLWNEQGMRWAWKVMVREKHGAVTFHVRDPDTGRSMQVNPARFLTPRQLGEMSSQPDLILQLAQHVAEDFRIRGFGRRAGRVEVRAETLVSLNGRRPVPMIDPNVDLAGVRDGLAPAAWILKAPAKPPIHLRSPRWARAR